MHSWRQDALSILPDDEWARKLREHNVLRCLFRAPLRHHGPEFLLVIHGAPLAEPEQKDSRRATAGLVCQECCC